MSNSAAEHRHEPNAVRNKEHYDSLFRTTSIERIVERVRHVDAFLADAIRTDTSWVALYRDGFRERLRGARVLELGSGDGLNSLVMAAVGANVVSIDISNVASEVLNEAAARLGLSARVTAMAGDFAELPFETNSFDFVVGKAFLHHLTHDEESRYLAKAASLLKPNGEVRFAEPAVNSQLLDGLRWLVPVPGRPSWLMRRAFKAYQAADPHPARDNSSAHYEKHLARYFESVSVVPFGALERLHRLLPAGEFNRAFRRAAFRAERVLPAPARNALARAQLIVGRGPRPSLPLPAARQPAGADRLAPSAIAATAEHR